MLAGGCKKMSYGAVSPTRMEKPVFARKYEECSFL
jgi:hypothetical protein